MFAGLIPLAYPTTYTAQVHLPRNGTTHNGLGLPIVLTINKSLQTGP